MITRLCLLFLKYIFTFSFFSKHILTVEWDEKYALQYEKQKYSTLVASYRAYYILPLCYVVLRKSYKLMTNTFFVQIPMTA